MLKEASLLPFLEYIQIRQDTIVVYVMKWPVFVACKEGEREQGSVSHRTVSSNLYVYMYELGFRNSGWNWNRGWVPTRKAKCFCFSAIRREVVG